MSEMIPNIFVDGLTFSYPNQKFVFKNLTFKSRNYTNKGGYVLALMGESGSGKSTLLKILLGLEKVGTGSVIKTPSSPKVSFVPQEAVLFEHLTPRQNAEYFKSLKHHRNDFDQNIYDNIAATLQLKEVLENSKSINELSGGQRQRLSLLRALSIKPHFLYLDEPLTGLDAEVKKQFLVQLRKIVNDYNIFTIYVTHHKLETALIADEVVYLIKKPECPVSLVAQNDVKEFLNNPPSLDAARVFGYPDLDVLCCKIEEGRIIPCNAQDPGHLFITFNDEQIFFENEDFGFDFKIVSVTPVYTTITIENSDSYINVKSEVSSSAKKLIIRGEVNKFDKDYQFLGKIKIREKNGV